MASRKKRIMDFQLKTLTTAQASNKKTDALIVLVADGALPAGDAISTLIAQARKAGDLLTSQASCFRSTGHRASCRRDWFWYRLAQARRHGYAAAFRPPSRRSGVATPSR